MLPQSADYTKRQILQFLAVFYTAAILCAVTIYLGGSAVPPPLATPFTMSFAVVGLAVVLPLMLWYDVKVRHIRVLFFSVMHIFAAVILILYLGSYNPMATMWLILCIVSYAEFGFPAFVLSSVFLYSCSIIFCIVVQPSVSSDFPLGAYVFYSMSFCAALVLTAYIITRILRNSDIRQRELERMRKTETAQLYKVNAILNSIGDAILTLDTDNRVTSQNAAALSFFDTNETLVGKRITHLLKIEDESSEPIDVKKMVADITRSQSRDDIVMPNKDLGNMRISLQMSPIYADNHRQGIVMVLSDITKQKTLEEEKDEFISVASHELRTPIAIAEGSLSNLVVMQDKGMDPSKLKSAAATAHDQVVYLAGVVNDLSTLSRAERGVADKAEPVDVTQLMHDLYTKYEPDATKKSLRMELDVKPNLPIVEVSRLYMEEMLQNLITNALKYTKEGSVTLAAEVVSDGVKCSVIDTGIGISKSDQKHLGERFFRSEDYRTRETSGTGLGLYVVDKLADKIGTKIEVASRLNHGSTFSVVIPLKSDAQSTGKRSSVNES